MSDMKTYLDQVINDKCWRLIRFNALIILSSLLHMIKTILLVI